MAQIDIQKIEKLGKDRNTIHEKVYTTYTEPHHLVPLSAQDKFPDVNLDREQNIVSLCSACHNQLHYGKDFENILKPLYEERKELLKLIGINISYEQLRTYYI